MAAGDLTTVAQVQAWLNTSADDDLIQTLITDISTFVSNALQRGILSASYVEIYRGNGGDQMLLRQRPAIAVALVEWPGFSLSAQGDVFAQTPGIATDGRKLFLIGYSMPCDAPVRVTYTAGYATVPADVAGAVTELVGEEYTRRTHIGETSHSTGGQTTVAFSRDDMHAAIRSKLSNYMPGAPC